MRDPNAMTGSDVQPPLPRPVPERLVHAGRTVRLEPLAPSHVDALWLHAEGADASFAFLRYGPFDDRAALAACVQDLAWRPQQPFWAVRTLHDDRVKGWLSLCDAYPADGAIEIGSVWFSPALQRTRASTEAVFLLMCHAFDVLGYHRLVWRCVARNGPSAHAARRYGFAPEGQWRNALFLRGRFEDIAWHAMLRADWPARRAAIAAWLDDANFDDAGRAKRSLAAMPA